MYDYTENGMLFYEYMTGLQGARFILFPADMHSLEDIAEAKRELRSERDVVSLSMATAEDRDDFYKSNIFRDKRVKSLKQVELDDNLVRKERLKGTSSTDFVTKYVLSN